MFSVLIPSYNTDCLPLVNSIYKQAKILNVPFEIIIADDASDEQFRDINRVIDAWEEGRYIQCNENKGPAVLRNLLADEAKYDYLLFLDTDTFPVADTFLSNYLKAAKHGLTVCGGFTYKGLSIPANATLRYKYGAKVEEKPAEERARNPYESFISMNFMIEKSAFNKVRFDEGFHLGYEDTYFGMNLKRAGVDILHIDNPVYHKVGESCEQFLTKIERAVSNLVGHEEQLEEYVKLLRWYGMVKKMRLTRVTAYLYLSTKKAIIAQLKSRNPSLSLFAFYKLGYFCSLQTNSVGSNKTK